MKKIIIILVSISIIVLCIFSYHIYNKNKTLDNKAPKQNINTSTNTIKNTTSQISQSNSTSATTSQVSQNANANNYTSYNEMLIQNLSAKQKNKIITDANKVLDMKSLPTVTDKTKLIASGQTKNDYISMAPYLWQDKNNPNKYIVKDGVDNPLRLDNNEFDSHRLQKFESQLTNLSMAYKLTGSSKYSDMANMMLESWFINPATKMNPNMKYAEIFETASGKTIFTGSSMISSVPLINIVGDINMLGNSVSSTDTTSLKSWFNTFSNWLLQTNGGNTDKLRINNHGTWLDAELGTFYDYADDSTMAKKVLNSVGADAINPQIQASGKIPSALVRTKSLDYSEYNLEVFITLANLGNKYDINIWNYKSENDGSIEKALDYVTNYLVGNTKWKYQNITGKDVNETNNNKFITYLQLANNHYKNKQYSKVIEKYSKAQ